MRRAETRYIRDIMDRKVRPYLRGVQASFLFHEAEQAERGNPDQIPSLDQIATVGQLPS